MSLRKILVFIITLSFWGCGYQMGIPDPRTSFKTYSLSGNTAILACQKAAHRLDDFGLLMGTDKNLSGFVLHCITEELDRRALSIDASSLLSLIHISEPTRPY